MWNDLHTAQSIVDAGLASDDIYTIDECTCDSLGTNSLKVTEFRDMLMNNAAILRSSSEHVRESEL